MRSLPALKADVRLFSEGYFRDFVHLQQVLVRAGSPCAVNA